MALVNLDQVLSSIPCNIVAFRLVMKGTAQEVDDIIFEGESYKVG